MFRNRFLLVPFVIFILAFCIDKIISSETFEPYYSLTLSDLNFRHKESLFVELKDYLKLPERKKVIVYFGNSRALLFRNDYIEKKYPAWILYNFSVPGGSPDYYLYWLERFRNEGVKPDFILMDESIEIFNSSSVLTLDEVLFYGLSPWFVLRHANRYSSSDLTGFIGKKLFHTLKNRPRLNVIRARAKDGGFLAKGYSRLRSEIGENLRKQRGSATSDASPRIVLASELLKKRSNTDFKSYLTPFTFNPKMLANEEDAIRIIREIGVPYATIWVRVARPYFELYKTKKVMTEEKREKTPYEIMIPILEKLHQSTNTTFWNMNEDPNYDCDDFSDPGHMSPSCFNDYADFIFTRLPK
ncbi:DUF1574 domain-containing protein [Leptospira gomenensis]|uniref:DUF1574 domain-containing protein n=1 Tax=Leptospira gomenensis TaxID=2484974 RepID=A0A5F1YT95_9LEPT|nr:DUF1574 domain-containing protein [Leptospira gomenensis]TGK38670.1 DUF1574 domain-containing protein [Leptospira gomenensis]TGK49548.1 DUF1574 domain-containing protein [Leptospira gomenensis]TGK60782.1 DUF1574 domain-containing protein [Leptospira gomenensis]